MDCGFLFYCLVKSYKNSNCPMTEIYEMIVLKSRFECVRVTPLHAEDHISHQRIPDVETIYRMTR